MCHCKSEKTIVCQRLFESAIRLLAIACCCRMTVAGPMVAVVDLNMVVSVAIDMVAVDVVVAVTTVVDVTTDTAAVIVGVDAKPPLSI